MIQTSLNFLSDAETRRLKSSLNEYHKDRNFVGGTLYEEAFILYNKGNLMKELLNKYEFFDILISKICPHLDMFYLKIAHMQELTSSSLMPHYDNHFIDIIKKVPNIDLTKFEQPPQTIYTYYLSENLDGGVFEIEENNILHKITPEDNSLVQFSGELLHGFSPVKFCDTRVSFIFEENLYDKEYVNSLKETLNYDGYYKLHIVPKRNGMCDIHEHTINRVGSMSDLIKSYNVNLKPCWKDADCVKSSPFHQVVFPLINKASTNTSLVQ